MLALPFPLELRHNRRRGPHSSALEQLQRDVPVADHGRLPHQFLQLRADRPGLAVREEPPEQPQAMREPADRDPQIVHRLGIPRFGGPVDLEGESTQQQRGELVRVLADGNLRFHRVTFAARIVTGTP